MSQPAKQDTIASAMATAAAGFEPPLPTTKKEEKKKNPWLHAWYDPVAGIKAYSNCICSSFLNDDSDSLLVVADASKKLKVFKGTALLNEIPLLGVPTVAVSYYGDALTPRIPAVAVGSGTSVYIYKSLRPFYKFNVPATPIKGDELKAWQSLTKGEGALSEAVEKLAELRDNATKVSTLTLELLALETPEKQSDYIDRCKDQPLEQITSIVAMGVLKKCLDDEDAVGSLVIGTEDKQVLILNPQGVLVLKSVELPSTAVNIVVVGLYDVEYRLFIGCRDNNVYIIKNGDVISTKIELEVPLCGMCKVGQNIIIACMDNSIQSYTQKGKKNWSMPLQLTITNLEAIPPNRSRTIAYYLVALSNGEVRVYNERLLVSTLETGEVISGLWFGRYGREDNTLAVIHKSGALTFKMLSRHAEWESTSTKAGPPPEQEIPLNVPKKTKLYVEQTQREREQAVDMHRVFQRDLCNLRLATAQAYVKMITDGQGPMSISSGTSLRLNAQVQGLGPDFKIKLTLQNSGTKSLAKVPVAVKFNPQLYKTATPLLYIPLLIPSIQIFSEIEITCIDIAAGSGVVNIYVCNPNSSVPLVSAAVQMPLSEEPL